MLICGCQHTFTEHRLVENDHDRLQPCTLCNCTTFHDGVERRQLSPNQIKTIQNEVDRMSLEEMTELQKIQAEADRRAAVDHPAHYGGRDNPYEAIKVIEAWQLPFHPGNAVKYLARMGKKPGEEMAKDVLKAIWYLKRFYFVLTGKEAP